MTDYAMTLHLLTTFNVFFALVVLEPLEGNVVMCSLMVVYVVLDWLYLVMIVILCYCCSHCEVL